MKPPRLIAILTLLGWLFAFGHVSLEHCGSLRALAQCAVLAGSHHSETFANSQSDPHHHEDPSDEHHHHEFGLSQNVRWQKSELSGHLLPSAAILNDALLAPWLGLVREALTYSVRPHPGNDLPDVRCTGWLFVVRTALPVRGPSLAA